MNGSSMQPGCTARLAHSQLTQAYFRVPEIGHPSNQQSGAGSVSVWWKPERRLSGGEQHKLTFVHVAGKEARMLASGGIRLSRFLASRSKERYTDSLL